MTNPNPVIAARDEFVALGLPETIANRMVALSFTPDDVFVGNLCLTHEQIFQGMTTVLGMIRLNVSNAQNACRVLTIVDMDRMFDPAWYTDKFYAAALTKER